MMEVEMKRGGAVNFLAGLAINPMAAAVPQIYMDSVALRDALPGAAT